MLALLPLADGPNQPLAIVAFLGWITLGVIQLILFIAALVSIISSRRYTGGGKFLWVVVVFLAPLLGAIGWFLAGRKARIRTDAP